MNLPPISNYSSRQKWEEACWRKISKSQPLLMRLVTPYERRNLVLRTAVMEKLRLGKSYRQIAEELWLSSQTISVIKKATKETSYRSYYDRGKTERKKKVYSHRKPPPDLKKLYGPSVRTKYGVMYPP